MVFVNEAFKRRVSRYVLAGFGGCGSPVMAEAFPHLGIGILGFALALGLTVITMAFAVGHISGCHLDPAVTVGLAVGRRFPSNNVLAYIAVQVLAAVVASAVLYSIASRSLDFLIGGFAANGFAEHSPGRYSMMSARIAEGVLSFLFLLIILGATDKRPPAGFAPLACLGGSDRGSSRGGISVFLAGGGRRAGRQGCARHGMKPYAAISG